LNRREDSQEMDPLEEKVRLLSLVKVFESLSREELRDLTRRIPEIPLHRGQTLYTANYRRRIFFLLLKGRVRLYEMADGREFTLLVVEAGELFGEVAFTGEEVRGTYAQAMTDCAISVMSYEIFEGLVMRHPEVGLKLLELLSGRLSVYGSRLVDLGVREVQARLAGHILRLVKSEGVITGEGIKIPTRYTHRQLGTMIGANREAVTNAFIRLRSAGAVRLVHRYIHVDDVKVLEQIAHGG
jgi:CRP/FNR family cyclic AMP-dependent transcriptional regulator